MAISGTSSTLKSKREGTGHKRETTGAATTAGVAEEITLVATETAGEKLVIEVTGKTGQGARLQVGGGEETTVQSGKTITISAL